MALSIKFQRSRLAGTSSACFHPSASSKIVGTSGNLSQQGTRKPLSPEYHCRKRKKNTILQALHEYHIAIVSKHCCLKISKSRELALVYNYSDLESTAESKTTDTPRRCQSNPQIATVTQVGISGPTSLNTFHSGLLFYQPVDAALHPPGQLNPSPR